LKVRLVRTGGVAGVRVVSEIESGDLTQDESLRLDKLVKGAEWSGLPTKTMRKPQARDLMEYAITLGGGAQQRTIVGDDLTLPPEARELVAFVIERGRHLKAARR
jgi:hypothetical protein